MLLENLVQLQRHAQAEMGTMRTRLRWKVIFPASAVLEPMGAAVADK